MLVAKCCLFLFGLCLCERTSFHIKANRKELCGRKKHGVQWKPILHVSQVRKLNFIKSLYMSNNPYVHSGGAQTFRSPVFLRLQECYICNETVHFYNAPVTWKCFKTYYWTQCLELILEAVHVGDSLYVYILQCIERNRPNDL